MGKNGFDPAIKSGTQQFEHLGKWATVCYWGYSLDKFVYGDRVFFQHQQGTYWLGTIERVCFVFGFAPIFPDICYHLTHYKPAAADIPVASDNPAH
ncbi:hypothetical protein NEN86_26005, partial [Escherichia coli]|nr:hypothetical protein [Escherichia coli]